MLALEEDLKKAEAKLLAAVRERTGLAANVTTLERQRAELKKVNEFLKNKVCFLCFDVDFCYTEKSCLGYTWMRCVLLYFQLQYCSPTIEKARKSR